MKHSTAIAIALIIGASVYLAVKEPKAVSALFEVISKPEEKDIYEKPI